MEISPQITIPLVFGGPKKQVQLTLNVNSLEELTVEIW
jgi:hypothetical protein